jgi:chemotaxis protein MotB
MLKSFFPALLITVLLSSCLVTKKKFDEMSYNKQKAIDSLGLVLDKNKLDYKVFRQKYENDLNNKEFLLDSVINEVNNLTNDTTDLSQSLKNAIKEYELERNKLITIEERLNHKSFEIDSLNMEQMKRNKQIDSLQLSLMEKQKRLSQLEDMIEKNKEEVNKLKKIINDALKNFDNTELNVYLKDGKVYVAMEEKLLFKTGSSLIDKRGKDAIIKLGKILENNTETEILIEGHTDNTGPDKYNWKLSTERALSVVDILLENTNISPLRITASGRGMHRPVADNNTETGRQKNRRIEIILVPKLDSLFKIMNE